MTCTLCDLPTNGRPIADDDVDGEFCCRGCFEVYRHLPDDENDDANDGRYDIDNVNPVATDSDENTTEVEDSETTFFSIEGMRCPTCELFLEHIATGLEGIIDARSSYATDAMRIRHDPTTVSETEIAEELTRFGYRASITAEEGQNHDEGESSGSASVGLEFGRYRAVIAVLVMMPVMAPYLVFIYPTYLGVYPRAFLYAPTLTTVVYVPLFVWSTIAVVGLGYPIFRGAYVGLRVRRPNMDLLIALGVLAAYGYSVAALGLGRRDIYFDVAVMILVVVTIGTHLESRLKRDALGARAALTDDRIETVQRLLPNGSTETVAADECERGDHVLVRSGERIPADGTIADGTATIDESLLTGESLPRSKSIGDPVLGGTVVVDDAIVAELEDTQSTRDQLVELLWNARGTTEGQRLADRFAAAFIPLVIGIAALTVVAWTFLGASLGTAILVGISVLVISCPCSLGIATPLALAFGTNAAATERVAVTNADVFERLTNSSVIVFDKTGTLTMGDFTVEQTIPAANELTSAVLARAAAVEEHSNHPIAKAIIDAADEPLTAGRGTEFERHSRSVSATVDGNRVVVGHPSAFSDEWGVPVEVNIALEDTRGTDERPIVVGWDGVVRGVIVVRDSPRAGWDRVLDVLATEGRQLVVLTGDDGAASRFGAHPAVDRVFAGVRPESKQVIIDRLRASGPTTMIGDGTNDAPALASADLGIALSSGTGLALDAADAIVMDESLESIPAIVDIATATRRRIRRNLVWAIGYNAVAVPLAVVGLINPLLAAVMMAISSLLVVATSGYGSRSGLETAEAIESAESEEQTESTSRAPSEPSPSNT
jgi:P-type Cu2+ transporter